MISLIFTIVGIIIFLSFVCYVLALILYLTYRESDNDKKRKIYKIPLKIALIGSVIIGATLLLSVSLCSIILITH
jgi:amino acid transporter